MLRILLSVAFCVALILDTARAQAAPPPIEAYGTLPAISDIAISPSGKLLAFINRTGETNAVQVIDLENNSSVFAGGIGDTKAGAIEFAGEDFVIIRAAKTTRITGFRGKIAYSGGFSINLKTEKIKQLLLNRNRSGSSGSNFKSDAVVYPGQSGLGKIVGRKAGTDKIYMPAFTGVARTSNPPYSLLEVDLETGYPSMHSSGRTDTVDWFVDTDGTILAQENYNNQTNKYRLQTKKSGKWVTIQEYESARGPGGLIGITPDKSALVLLKRNRAGFNELRSLSFDGTESGPLMSKPDTEINYALVDIDRVVHGVAYGGLQPSYDFFDKDVARAVTDMQAKVPTASVRLISWSDGFEKMVFYIEGSIYAGDYFILDRKTSDLRFLSSSRPDIPKDAIGEVLTINYKAADGLEIPGVMTVHNGSDMKNLPAIIMPHGGPEAHDDVSFDYMAQYFASRGFLVFQPNFRGSDGFGREFTEAGYGGWGGVMQQDITDGVEALKNGGMIDPDRVCIVGWSYGGYAALAGGAFTPDLYKCVVAVAPVSDLPRMLYDERKDHGRDHWVVSYWEGAIAKGDASRDFLGERSPAFHADKFKAPVLLIHGKDDFVVDINQSTRMQSALKKAGKDVKLITMKGQDHSLSTRGARLEALKAMDAFVESHIGSGN